MQKHLPQEDTDMPEEIETVVIGGGQAGLAISYYLTQQGRPHVVLEQTTQIAPAWRHGRWDSFTLVTPNWSVRLPSFPYQGDDPDGFMPRADVVRHLERYAASFQAPVRCGVQVTAVDPARDGQGYRVATADGVTYAAATVVVATGSFQFPKPSPFTGALPPEILQLHSSHYRNPSALPPGAVLVVGSADSGCQIVEELNESGRRVYLCVGRAIRRPRRYRGKDSLLWGITMGRLEQTADQLPSPSARFAPNSQLSGKNGGHTLNLHRFARNGVVLLGRLVGVDGHRIALAPDLEENLTHADRASEDFKKGVDEFVHRTGMDAPEPEPDPIDEVRSDAGRHAPAALDLKAAGITTVIWATGYGFDYSWVHLPVFDDYGFPVQQRGVTRFPGLYFLGMHFLYNRKSGILLGVGEDAAHIAAVIAARG
jgi:putative flavoprotein involved in K+ transport